MKGKKAIVYSIGIILIELIVLTYAFLMFGTMDSSSPPDYTIGKRQGHLFDMIKQSEKISYYLENSLTMAVDQSSYDLAASGFDINKNNEYFGFTIIDTGANTNDLFEKEFESNFGNILKNYPDMSISTDQFNIHLDQNGDKMSISAESNSALDINTNTDYKDGTDPEDYKQEEPDYPLVDVSLSGIACSKDDIDPCLVNATLIEPLKKANALALKAGHTLIITSSYRSYESQLYLWEHGTKRNPEWAGDRTKIAYPSKDSPHVTGKAVDITFAAEDMGSEPSEEMTPIRQELANIMYEAGFVRYENEWWHYEYHTDRWDRAEKVGVNAIV